MLNTVISNNKPNGLLLDIIIDKKSKFYYVYVYLTDNKDDAIKSAKDALKQGVGDCWIQVLVE